MFLNRMQLVWRGLVAVARDMFIGFILGLGAAVLMAKINPATGPVVALLIPAGALAGILKGSFKFIFLNISSFLPSKGYRHDYPKYRILAFWLLITVLCFGYAYGLNIRQWFLHPLELLGDNFLLGSIGKGVWTALFLIISLSGTAAHLYEPPVDNSEALPPEEPEEHAETEENAQTEPPADRETADIAEAADKPNQQ